MMLAAEPTTSAETTPQQIPDASSSVESSFQEVEFSRVYRPTSMFELLDRTFVFWRDAVRQYVAWGIAAVLPPLCLQGFILIAAARGKELSEAELAPWVLLGLALQLFPVTVLFYQASLQVGVPGARALNLPMVLRTYPRVVVSVLCVLFSAGIFLNMGLLAAGEVAPNPLALVAILGGVAAALFVSASFALAPVLAVEPGMSLFSSLAMSYRLMRMTRFHRSWWRDNAYWRLALLVSFPLCLHAIIFVLSQASLWLHTGTIATMGKEPLRFLFSQAIISAGADAFLVPWSCLALVLLKNELEMRSLGKDFLLHLWRRQRLDTCRPGE